MLLPWQLHSLEIFILKKAVIITFNIWMDVFESDLLVIAGCQVEYDK